MHEEVPHDGFTLRMPLPRIEKPRQYRRMLILAKIDHVDEAIADLESFLQLPQVFILKEPGHQFRFTINSSLLALVASHFVIGMTLEDSKDPVCDVLSAGSTDRPAQIS